ncbi:hypothetical protein NDU88_002538 [Pleurodeles waltl]|uniref:Uncharacterized protein n=1 Tax=Pleurodeles waltl TaxID=8319 RepID=A0AAV7LG61_PLEWA|nr:hypothetical protein NDU88_002538 [Pleurodeles waltl]
MEGRAVNCKLHAVVMAVMRQKAATAAGPRELALQVRLLKHLPRSHYAPGSPTATLAPHFWHSLASLAQQLGGRHRAVSTADNNTLLLISPQTRCSSTRPVLPHPG